MSGIIPNSVRDRRDKLGFSTPEKVWFCGPLKDLVYQGIEDTITTFPHLLNSSAVRGLAKDTLDGMVPVDFSIVADYKSWHLGQVLQRKHVMMELFGAHEGILS